TLPPRLSRVQVRRLQLAAEQGGGVGIFLRTRGPGSSVYAAASRWRVSPAPGERTIQRWTIQLIHGQGRLVGQTFLLEKSRDTTRTHLACARIAPAHSVHPPAAVVDHASVSQA